jgi:hypothetical protein
MRAARTENDCNSEHTVMGYDFVFVQSNECIKLDYQRILRGGINVTPHRNMQRIPYHSDKRTLLLPTSM